MADPGYDFFATGGPTPPPAPTVPQPTGPVTVSPSQGFAAPAPAPTPFPVSPAAGYQSGAVNHFGTPLDVQAAPTGPYAAPGIAAVPTSGPGLVSAWDPAGAAHHRAAQRQAVARPTRPQGVKVAGIIGVLEGLLVLVLTVWALVGYLNLRSEVDALTDATGSGTLTGAVTGAVLFGVVILGAIAALYLVAGFAALQAKRWGAWILLVVSGLNVAYALYGVAAGTSSFASVFLTLLISGAVVVMLLTTESRRWLMNA